MSARSLPVPDRVFGEQDEPPLNRLFLQMGPDRMVRDLAEECWRIVEPIVSAWERGVPPLLSYPAGSQGPT